MANPFSFVQHDSFDPNISAVIKQIKAKPSLIFIHYFKFFKIICYKNIILLFMWVSNRRFIRLSTLIKLQLKLVVIGNA